MISFVNDLSSINDFFHSLVNQFFDAAFTGKFKYILFTVIFITVMPFVIDIIFSFVLSVSSKRFVMFHSLLFKNKDLKNYSLYSPVKYHSFFGRVFSERRYSNFNANDLRLSKFRTYLLNRFGIRSTNHMNIGSPRSMVVVSRFPLSPTARYPLRLASFVSYSSKYSGSRFSGFSSISRNLSNSLKSDISTSSETINTYDENGNLISSDSFTRSHNKSTGNTIVNRVVSGSSDKASIVDYVDGNSGDLIETVKSSYHIDRTFNGSVRSGTVSVFKPNNHDSESPSYDLDEHTRNAVTKKLVYKKRGE